MQDDAADCPLSRAEAGITCLPLPNCAVDDIIMVSDLDEFIDARKWPQFLESLNLKDSAIVGCGCYFYRWFLNRMSCEPWVGTAVCRYDQLLRLSPQGLRELRSSDRCVAYGGWHFSNMGGLTTYVQKIEAFSHAEADRPDVKDPINIDWYIRSDLLLVPIDETFPKMVRENREEFVLKGFIDSSDRLFGKLSPD